MGTATATRPTELTCAMDQRAHLVTDDALPAALTAGHGCFRALCGHVVAASSLSAPDGQPCRACASVAEGDRPRRGHPRHRPGVVQAVSNFRVHASVPPTRTTRRPTRTGTGTPR